MDSKKQKKKQDYLQQQVSSKHPGLQFLVEELSNDTSKQDLIQNVNYDYSNMVEDMIGHYQKLQDLDESIPEFIQKYTKKRKGELWNSSQKCPYSEYEVQFPMTTKLVNVNNGAEQQQPKVKKQKSSDGEDQCSPVSQSRSPNTRIPKPINVKPSSKERTANLPAPQPNISPAPIKKIAIRKDSLQAFKQLVSEKNEEKKKKGPRPNMPTGLPKKMPGGGPPKPGAAPPIPKQEPAPQQQPPAAEQQEQPIIKFNEQNAQRDEPSSTQSIAQSEMEISNGRKQQLNELKQVVKNDQFIMETNNQKYEQHTDDRKSRKHKEIENSRERNQQLEMEQQPNKQMDQSMMPTEDHGKKSRNHQMDQSYSMGNPAQNQSMMGGNLNKTGTMIQLPRTQAENKPKQRVAPKVRASGKYGMKNSKEENRKVMPNFAKRKESMNQIVEQNASLHIQIQMNQIQQMQGMNVSYNQNLNQTNVMNKRTNSNSRGNQDLNQSRSAPMLPQIKDAKS